MRQATGLGLIEQGEGDLGFSLKSDRLRDVRFLCRRTASCSPLAGQVEAGGDRPGDRPLRVVAIDRHLTIGQFPGRPGVLAGDADRVRPFLFKAGVIKDEGPIPFALERQTSARSAAG